MDPFHSAINAIDTGNIQLLENLLTAHPGLISQRAKHPQEGYFKYPFLLWFIANNPIRHEGLPSNIVDITRLLVRTAKTHAAASLQEQLDYTLGLVATGRIPRECGVQIALIDLLVDEGAKPGNGHGALAHGNPNAAKRLIERGGRLTLTTAVGLNRIEEVKRLASEASVADRQCALMAAALFGNAEMIQYLLQLGVDPSAYIDPSSGFHSHASPLHQAVYSASLEAVKSLVEADANLEAIDRVHEGTPMGWARYLQREETDRARKENFKKIEAYLMARAGT